VIGEDRAGLELAVVLEKNVHGSVCGEGSVIIPVRNREMVAPGVFKRVDEASNAGGSRGKDVGVGSTDCTGAAFAARCTYPD
jgi:hypothetical protein